MSDPLHGRPETDELWLPGRVRRRLGDVLLASGALTEEEHAEALAAQRTVIGPRRRLGHVLVDAGLVSEQQIVEALAEQLELDVVDLNRFPVQPEVARLLPRTVAQRLGVLVTDRDGSHVTVAVSDPTDVFALDDVRLRTGATSLTVLVATETQVRDHLTRAWSLAGDSSDMTTYFEDVEVGPTESENAAAAAEADDAPTVRLVGMLLADAVHVGASDVHLEPQASGLRVRYRVDGMLREVMTVPRGAQASVVSRLKIVSGIDIAERRLPQDGRTRITVDTRPVDARVSTIPSLHGEKVVVRLLTRAEQVPRLGELGLEPGQLDDLRRAVESAQGLVLITGPTGSGKTSTLYSALHEIQSPVRNVITLEDPVEVQMAGITQVQVHERSGLTFGRGLRAVLRQDPDVVLVGEVRDSETAELAIKAALTGHLVLTTLHTNSAVSAVSRLVDMGVEPFLVGTSISTVVAQRLVRRPCPTCAVPDEAPDPGLLAQLGVTEDALTGSTPRRAVGCAECGDTGYRGRVGVFEVLPIDAVLRQVLSHDPSEQALAHAARGMTRLHDAAAAKALAGVTTFEEAARVIPRP
ncbi:MAG: GspE/PulE family protein [Actinomycetes bacterium]